MACSHSCNLAGLESLIRCCNINGRSVYYVFSIGMFLLASILINWHLLRGNIRLGADIFLPNFKLDLHSKAVVIKSKK